MEGNRTTSIVGAANNEVLDPSYLERLMRARVDESVLLDVIEQYATERFTDTGSRDEFIAQMSEPPYGEQVRKAILDMVFAVIAASELPTEAAFRALIDILHVGEEDDALRGVKRTCLATMSGESEFDDADDTPVSEAQFQARMAYVVERIDAG